MIKVIEEKTVPTGKIECPNCRSILEYGNADLYKDHSFDTDTYVSYIARYCLTCPICGVEMNAPWINSI